MGLKLGSLVVLLLIVILLFGTKALRNIGEDLAVAIRNFREGLREEDKKE
jgi:sec-independent protein translocase protein TatA